jgi:hypothetical protein
MEHSAPVDGEETRAVALLHNDERDGRVVLGSVIAHFVASVLDHLQLLLHNGLELVLGHT